MAKTKPAPASAILAPQSLVVDVGTKAQKQFLAQRYIAGANLRDGWRAPTPVPTSVPNPGVAPTRLERKMPRYLRAYSREEMAELMWAYARKGGGR